MLAAASAAANSSVLAARPVASNTAFPNAAATGTNYWGEGLTLEKMDLAGVSRDELLARVAGGF